MDIYVINLRFMRSELMKSKIIEKILGKKFDKFLSTIEDEKVKELVAENTIITGGAIASFLLGKEVNDYDMYFRNLDTTLKVAHYYVDKFCKENDGLKYKYNERISIKPTVLNKDNRVKIIAKSVGVVGADQVEEYQYFESLDPGDPQTDEFVEDALYAFKNRSRAKKGEYKPIFMTTNAITLSDSVQLVIRFYGEPEEIHENYDFVHCTNYWTSWERELVLRPEALESLLLKDLRYVGSLYPLTSIMRIRKFVKRGWSINAGQILKIALNLNKFDLSDPKILEDQLIGVDISYFNELLHRLNTKDTDKIDEIYVCQLIDEIF